MTENHWSNVGEELKLSGRVDLTSTYDAATVAEKTIIITGGASGIGAACARTWADLGAFVVIADINEDAGKALVRDIGANPRWSHKHLFVRCDVRRWADVWDLFNAAVAASPTNSLDAVVLSAGIMEVEGTITGRGFEHPKFDGVGAGAMPPPPPVLDVVAVNLLGAMNTVHSSLYFLPRNRGISPPMDKHDTNLAADRHILFVGSLASVCPMPGQPLYTASKHGIMGLFRSIRGTSYLKGVRCNMVAPYLVDTPLVPPKGMAMAAGVPKTDMADIVDAATRLMADKSIRGRALMVGPRLRVCEVETSSTKDQNVRATFEIYAHDYEEVELFVRRYISALNAIAELRGWITFFIDVFRVFWRAIWGTRPQRPKTLVEQPGKPIPVTQASGPVRQRMVMKMA